MVKTNQETLPSPNVTSFIVPTPPLPSTVSIDLNTEGLTLGAILSKSQKTLKTVSAECEEATSTTMVAVVMSNLTDIK